MSSSSGSLIAQAQLAARQSDWATVVTLLHALLVEDSAGGGAPPERAIALECAIQALSLSGDFQTQWDAAKLVPTFGTAAIAPLTALLEDEQADLEARWFAARILGELNDPTAIHALVTQLQSSEDEDLNQMIAEALANLGTPAIAALTELLQHPETRLFAVQALAQIPQPAIIEPLLSVVTDANPTLRAIALESLSNFPDPRIPSVLVAGLQDPVATVRQVAIAGLSRRSTPSSHGGATGGADAGAAVDRVALLANCLWDVNLSVCQRAALALGKLGQDQAVPHLERALCSPNTPLPLQLDLLRALSWIGSAIAIAPFKTVLTEPAIAYPAPVYQELLHLLGRWQTADLKPTALHLLTLALSQSPPIQADPQLRRTVAIAMGELRLPEAHASLTQLQADPDASVQLHATAALNMITTPDTLS